MKFKETAGVRLSAVGLGTFQFGAREWGYGAEYASKVAPKIVVRSLDLGVNLIDTAEVYGYGRSERIVGKALTSRRDEAFIATKLLPIMPIDPIVTRRASGSARRLGVKVIDLYQLHWPNPVFPPSATMTPLARLLRQGLLRYVGVSNYSLARWRQAEEALGAPVISNQVRYNLVDRRIEAELLPWAQQNDRLIIAYSPLHSGLLAGRYGPDHRPKGFRSHSATFLEENLRRAQPLIEALRTVGVTHDATPAQVALAWCLRRPNVIVIPGASSVAQAESNAEAADLELSDEEDAELTAASDQHRPMQGAQAYRTLAIQGGERFVGRVRRIAEGLRA